MREWATGPWDGVGDSPITRLRCAPDRRIAAAYRPPSIRPPAIASSSAAPICSFALPRTGRSSILRKALASAPTAAATGPGALAFLRRMRRLSFRAFPVASRRTGGHPNDDRTTFAAPEASINAQPGEHWGTWGAARHGARVVVTRTQKHFLALLALVVALVLFTHLRFGLIAFLDFVTVLYFVTGLHKVWLLIRGDGADAKSPPTFHFLSGDQLPVYTVMVPLHREGRILPALIDRLKRIDYPPERLQILLLIEEDDEETQSAARASPLPSHIRPMVMPAGQPRTKPRALNIGLHEALGEYVVIYDAEDQPEPDQLRKAAAALRVLPPDVVCVQARLIFYNRDQSLLTRLFAIDYAVWYSQFLPGLTSGLSRPSPFVPLGGTSNHFRLEVIRRIGGWDPFNVTEDCDLGVRLGRAGLRVAMLDSTTWEEAVPTVKPWIRQRSRWVKGYIQTYLVHMRRPLLLWRELGLRGFSDFQMLVGASSLLLLINPLMWALTAAYLSTKGGNIGNFIQALYPPAVYYPALLSLVVWNFIFFYSNAYVCVRHSFIDLTRYTLLTPFYWLLMSLGAWAGLISLIRNPFYWAKTEHGVSMQRLERDALAPESEVI
jgi:cellulose synthase/poly-beta-1,6-N-acetylglucosamine synthase-like glycosyltransferase